MERCFICGEPATHRVEIFEYGIPSERMMFRCEKHKDRAVLSFGDKANVTRIKD